MDAKGLMAAGVFACLTAWPAAAYDRLIVYGDSLSAKDNCRETNGKLWHEYLLPRLGLASDRLIVPAGCGAQALHLEDQLKIYPGDAPADANGRYVIMIGGNEYMSQLPTRLSNLQGYIDENVARIETLIRRLSKAGARHIVVPLLPDLGRVPAAANSPAAGLVTQVSAAHDRTLIERLPRLAEELNIKLTLVDSWRMFDSVMNDPARHGFRETRIPCYNRADCDWNGTVFKDIMHPTTAFHRVIADAVAEALQLPDKPAP